MTTPAPPFDTDELPTKTVHTLDGRSVEVTVPPDGWELTLDGTFVQVGPDA